MVVTFDTVDASSLMWRARKKKTLLRRGFLLPIFVLFGKLFSFFLVLILRKLKQICLKVLVNGSQTWIGSSSSEWRVSFHSKTLFFSALCKKTILNGLLFSCGQLIFFFFFFFFGLFKKLKRGQVCCQIPSQLPVCFPALVHSFASSGGKCGHQVLFCFSFFFFTGLWNEEKLVTLFLQKKKTGLVKAELKDTSKHSSLACTQRLQMEKKLFWSSACQCLWSGQGRPGLLSGPRGGRLRGPNQGHPSGRGHWFHIHPIPHKVKPRHAARLLPCSCSAQKIVPVSFS